MTVEDKMREGIYGVPYAKATRAALAQSIWNHITKKLESDGVVFYRKKESRIKQFIDHYNIPVLKDKNMIRSLIDLYCSRDNIFLKRPEPDFYNSRSWLYLRIKAIKIYGTKCMKCGCDDGSPHVDHIKPRSIYPELQLEIKNLQILCWLCNLVKSNRNEIDYRSTSLLE